MNRRDAIFALLSRVPSDAVIIASNGHVSRELYAVGDRDGSFYMIGSMGLAPSIALGIATARPEVSLITLDGDGNVLMNLGSLASVAARAPARFVHVCVDNGRHASTGGQRTISDQVDLRAVAAATGYRWTASTQHLGDVATLMGEALAAVGPSFLHLRVAPGGLPDGTPRVEIPPEDLSQRLRTFLA